MKLLIIEDEKALSESIVEYLSHENYVCETAFDCKEALEKIGLFDYDCILLDIMLPDGSGLMILEELKRQKRMEGVIIVSAKNAVDDRILSLNLGADDYLSKPYHLAELSARVQSIIRRRKLGGTTIISFKELTIDLPARSLCIDNKGIKTTKTEYDLLLFLIANKGKVISKNAIAEHLSGESAMYYDNFDVIYAHIKNLKKKLGPVGEHIKTIYGTGYKLEH